MKKLLAILLVSVMMLALVPASAELNVGSYDPASAGNVELRFGWWGNHKRDAVTLEALNFFTENYPNVTFNPNAQNWSNYWALMSTYASNNDLPDIMQQDYAYLQQWVEAGDLLDLTPYVESGALDVSGLSDSILKSGMVGDGLYALCAGVNAPSLLYNKTLTDSLDITVPDNINEDGYTLVGKPLVFSASNARVLSGKVVADAHNYNFEGSYYERDIKGTYVYKLDEEANGNNFVYMEDGATIEPFRGYFTSEAAPVEHNVLYVVSYIDVPTITGVKDLPVEPKANDGDMASTHDNIFRVYAITGTLVKTEKGKSLTEVLQSLPKGIYIINGKKYMR